MSAATAGLAMALNLGRPHPLLVLAGMIGLLFWVEAARNSAWGLAAVFSFAGFVGLVTGPVVQAYVRFLPNGGNVVITALGGTAAIFVGLSAYALISRRDFSKLGSMLTAGAIILLVASVANIFLHISGMSLVISAMAMVVFSGFMLYDTGRHHRRRRNQLHPRHRRAVSGHLQRLHEPVEPTRQLKQELIAPLAQ